MSKLIITRGLPASGKTTWARRWLAEDSERRLRVNRDDIRAMIGGYNRANESAVWDIRDRAIIEAFKHQKDVVNDDTNLKMSVARHLHKLAKLHGAEFEVNDSFLWVTAEECVRRDNHRLFVDPDSYVGEDVIREMHQKYLRGRKHPLILEFPDIQDPLTFEKLPNPPGKTSAIIVDLDGTICHNDGHRGFYEYEKVGGDSPKLDTVEVVKELGRSGYTLVFLSGREDSCYTDTYDWIKKYVIRESRINHRLLMRKSGDHRDDSVVKYEILRDNILPNFFVRAVFDDRDRVVKMWREVGLTCYQVDFGDF